MSNNEILSRSLTIELLPTSESDYRTKKLEVSLSLKKGLIYTLEGGNGAGKSTLIKALTGVYPPRSVQGTTTRISNQRDVTIKNTTDSINNGIVTIYQDDDLIPSMTFEEQIVFRHCQPSISHFNLFAPYNLQIEQVSSLLPKRLQSLLSVRPLKLRSKEIVISECKHLLNEYSNNSSTDYTQILRKYPRSLSGGAKAVARLVSAQLTPDIKILLLDEVLSGVQKDIRPVIIEKLRHWVKRNEVTLVVVTHQEEELVYWEPNVRLCLRNKDDQTTIVDLIEPSDYRMLVSSIPLRSNIYHILDSSCSNARKCIPEGSNILVLFDEQVKDTIGLNNLLENLKNGLSSCTINKLECVASERIKTLDQYCQYIIKISELLPQDNCVMVIVGGGTLINFASFLASTLHRGIPFILVPTTLMAMVDVAVGSKSSINISNVHGMIKNLVGTYANPSAIFLEKQFLASLSKRELFHGLSEIIKHGLMQDKDLFNDGLQLLEDGIQNRDLVDKAFLLVQRSLDCKIRILKADPFEKTDLGLFLLYGHLHAHAFEEISRGVVSHGLAVFLGLLIDLQITEKRNAFESLLLGVKSAKILMYPELKDQFQLLQRPESKQAIIEAIKSNPKSVYLCNEKDFYKILDIPSIGFYSGPLNSLVEVKTKRVHIDVIYDAILIVLGRLYT
jgi:3-dehydroquinate synthase